MNKTKDLIKDLETAKTNVKTLIDEPNALIDMKGLSYWAGVVERLRNEIKEQL